MDDKSSRVSRAIFYAVAKHRGLGPAAVLYRNRGFYYEEIVYPITALARESCRNYTTPSYQLDAMPGCVQFVLLPYSRALCRYRSNNAHQIPTHQRARRLWIFLYVRNTGWKNLRARCKMKSPGRRTLHLNWVLDTWYSAWNNYTS